MDGLSNEEGKREKLSVACFVGSKPPVPASPARDVLNAKEPVKLTWNAGKGRGGAGGSWANAFTVLGKLVVLTASKVGTTVTHGTCFRFPQLILAAWQ